MCRVLIFSLRCVVKYSNKTWKKQEIQRPFGWLKIEKKKFFFWEEHFEKLIDIQKGFYSLDVWVGIRGFLVAHFINDQNHFPFCLVARGCLFSFQYHFIFCNFCILTGNSIGKYSIFYLSIQLNWSCSTFNAIKFPSFKFVCSKWKS